MKNLFYLLSVKLTNLLPPDNGSGMNSKWTGYAPARPFTVFVLFCMLFLFGVGNVWGTTYTDRQFAFTSSTAPTGWETNGTFNTSYYKFDEDDYAQTTSVTAIISSGEVLDSDMDVKIACGRFGSWGSTAATQALTAIVQLLDGSGNVLSSNSATFTGLTAGIPYKSAITVSKPANPSAVAKLKIILGSFNTTSTGCARFGGVKLSYSTKTAASCSTNPSVGNASLNGTLNLTVHFLLVIPLIKPHDPRNHWMRITSEVYRIPHHLYIRSIYPVILVQKQK